jgi:Tfp pilus assembly protein PilX
MKRVYDNEQGFALVLALILSLVVLALVSGLLYLITQGTAMSGYQKRYETALEGAKGGVDLVTKDIIPQAAIGLASASALSTQENNLQTTYGSLNLQFRYTTSSCLLAKLTTTTLTGSTDNWKAAGCAYDMEATYLINPTTGAVVPDVQFVLQGPTAAQNYIVYAKIVDTVAGGMTYMGPNLLGAGVTESNPTAGQQIPNIYRIEVQAQRQQNPDERSNLSVLYAY